MLPLLVAFACSTPTPDPGDDTGNDSADTGDTGDTADTGSTPSWCQQLGLVERPWDGSGVAGEFDVVAPDLTLTTLDGEAWTLSQAWTGCESVIFVQVRPELAYPDFSNRRDVREWMDGAPENVHWVFFSDESTEKKRTEALEALQATIEEVADGDAATLAAWQAHTHYVPTKWSDTGTWVDDLVATYGGGSLPLNFAVDRFQRIRELGYLADPATNWASSPPSFLNYEARHYNAQAAVQDRLDAQAATVLRPFEASAERVATVDFGTAEQIAAYDTLELDLSFICNGHPDASGCGEWDYLAYVYLCAADDPATPDTDESTTCVEIGRFITAYARPGRWVVDASPFLAKLQEGGEHVVRVDSANAPYITLDLRLSNQGRGARPVAIEPLWGGGAFNESYNDGREAVLFTPPEDTVRVEVWTLITGHGYGQDRANCAEFCNHQHQFTVNDTKSWTQEFPEADETYGCADQVETGTVPNQYGTWVYGRGGWCPGRHVDPWSADITAAVQLGAPNTLSYLGLYEGEPYVPEPHNSGSGFGAVIVANTWLVYWR